MSEKNSDFAAGTLFGLVLGAGLAILFAPGSGPDTRRRIVDVAGDAADAANDLFGRGLLYVEAAVGMIDDEKKRSIISGKVEDLRSELNRFDAV